jgi:hypothetical protein
MYLRTTQRRNKDRSIVRYYALGENVRHGQLSVERDFLAIPRKATSRLRWCTASGVPIASIGRRWSG